MRVVGNMGAYVIGRELIIWHYHLERNFWIDRNADKPRDKMRVIITRHPLFKWGPAEQAF